MYNDKNKPETATRHKQITYNTETDVFLRLPFSIQLIDTENKKADYFRVLLSSNMFGFFVPTYCISCKTSVYLR